MNYVRSRTKRWANTSYTNIHTFIKLTYPKTVIKIGNIRLCHGSLEIKFCIIYNEFIFR